MLLRPLDVPLLVLSWAWLGGLLANGELEGSHTLAAVTAGLMATLAWVLLRGRREAAIPALTAGIVGPLYIGLPLSFALILRAEEQGWEWLLLGTADDLRHRFGGLLHRPGGGQAAACASPSVRARRGRAALRDS